MMVFYLSAENSVFITLPEECCPHTLRIILFRVRKLKIKHSKMPSRVVKDMFNVGCFFLYNEICEFFYSCFFTVCDACYFILFTSY